MCKFRVIVVSSSSAYCLGFLLWALIGACLPLIVSLLLFSHCVLAFLADFSGFGDLLNFPFSWSFLVYFVSYSSFLWWLCHYPELLISLSLVHWQFSLVFLISDACLSLFNSVCSVDLDFALFPGCFPGVEMFHQYRSTFLIVTINIFVLSIFFSAALPWLCFLVSWQQEGV
jgi:hypothetical protein